MKTKNTEYNLLVISSYPQKGKIHGKGTVGIASYAKNSLLSLLKAADKKKTDLKVLVLAERLNGGDEEVYNDSGLQVKRTWKRGSILTYFNLLKNIWQYKSAQKIILEFEFSMFGDFVNLVFLPVFLVFLKLFRREIIFVSHQAVDDINDLSGHVGLKENSLKIDIINLLVILFYKVTFAVVDKIIVFEEFLKQKLKKYTNVKKIVVIPHGVERFSKVITKESARKKLGIKNDEFTILYFGFIAWYKGTDWIVDKVKNKESRIKDKKIKLIIAGGVNPNHTDKEFYMDYVESIKREAQDSGGRIVVTGFIKEKDIPLYFQACDLVVLPYRTFMSSSGPLSLALSFKKPFLLSESLERMFKTSDFYKAAKKVSLNKDAVVFDLKNGIFERKIAKCRQDRDYMRKLTWLSQEIRKKRDFNLVGRYYYQEILNDLYEGKNID